MAQRPDHSGTPPSGWQIERSLQLWHTLHEALQNDPQLEHDEDVVLQQFDNVESTLDSHLDSLVNAAAWAAIREAEADALHKALEDRRNRYAARKDLLRRTIFDLLNVLRRRKHSTTMATVRVQTGPKSVTIVDESKLPDSCFIVTRAVSRTLIREHLGQGDDLQGAAVLSNAPDILVMTRVYT
jgi:hypothetical protein